MKLAQKGIIKLDLDDVVKSNYTTITSSSFNSKSLPRLLEACSKSSKLEGWTHVAPKKLHMKPTCIQKFANRKWGKTALVNLQSYMKVLRMMKLRHEDHLSPSQCAISSLKTSSIIRSRLLAMKIARNASPKLLDKSTKFSSPARV
ncbi:hypothetical protein ACFX19_013725 [Malus domestica]